MDVYYFLFSGLCEHVVSLINYPISCFWQVRLNFYQSQAFFKAPELPWSIGSIIHEIPHCGNSCAYFPIPGNSNPEIPGESLIVACMHKVLFSYSLDDCLAGMSQELSQSKPKWLCKLCLAE